MATKSVTLKDSNGDTLYPVTDSNVVNINQQKTLAQALDGVVYAEDPTQNATPTAWVTSGDIDWTTMPGSYSTTEQKTPFVWIDGKPIYKKTIDCGALPNATTKTVAHGISNIGLVIKYEATATYGPNSTQIPIPFVSDNLYAQVAIRVETNDIVLWCQADRTAASGYVTLLYTKTTD